MFLHNINTSLLILNVLGSQILNNTSIKEWISV